jgi:hypothetical protein
MDSRALLIVVALGPHTSLFHGISHLTNCNDRKKGHPSPLFGGEGLIERFPRLSKPLQVCRALRQAIGAFFHEFDGITIAQDFDTTTVTQFTRPFYGNCDAGLSVLRPSANSVLYRRPQFFLVRCQLQGGFDDFNSRIRQILQIGRG